jgi:GNAT superfamily N-acetyltransferase
MIKIARARSYADKLECNRLQVLIFQNGEHRDIHAPDEYWWLARVDGEPAGFACLKIMTDPNNKGAAYLALAGVLTKYRGYGIQKRLIRLREQFARSKGATVMISYVAWANWPSANSLIRNGYTIFTPNAPWGLKYSLYFKKDLTG